MLIKGASAPFIIFSFLWKCTKNFFADYENIRIFGKLFTFFHPYYIIISDEKGAGPNRILLVIYYKVYNHGACTGAVL